LIAVEPALCTAVFTALALGMIFKHIDGVEVFAPIFLLAAIAFAGYAVILMIQPVRALMQTFVPIYIVDGYIRYRRPDLNSEAHSNGYIGVLNEDRRQICEWAIYGKHPVVDAVLPALVEFTHFGGVHRIDGTSTGVLPTELTPLGIGTQSPERR
jgi:hypothetical protein